MTDLHLTLLLLSIIYNIFKHKYLEGFMDRKYKKMEILFLSLLGLQIVASLTSIFITSNEIILLFSNYLNYIKIFIMAAILSTVVYGNYYYKTKMKLAGEETDAEKKSQLNYLAYSVRLILLAVCNILNVLAFVVTSNEIYIIVTVPLLFLFFLYKPSRKLYLEQSATDIL